MGVHVHILDSVSVGCLLRFSRLKALEAPYAWSAMDAMDS